MKLTKAQLQTTAMVRFGITSDQQPLLAFAEWLLEQEAPAHELLIRALQRAVPHTPVGSAAKLAGHEALRKARAA